MGKTLDFVDNKEPLKIVINDYVEAELDIIHISNEYHFKKWRIFQRKKEREKDKKRFSKREFSERLHSYLWIPKISELLVILYVEDLKNNHLTIWDINKLLRRTNKQYGATLKTIDKLEKLNIIYTKSVKGSNRRKKQVFINKAVTKLYGEDEFRQMMLDEWNTDAKKYITDRVDYLLKEKAKVEKKIAMIKKGKRVKK